MRKLATVFAAVALAVIALGATAAAVPTATYEVTITNLTSGP